MKKVVFCCLVLAAAVQSWPEGTRCAADRPPHVRLLESPHFDVYHGPAEREAARHAIVLAERWYDKLSRLFGRGLERRHTLVLHATATCFRRDRANRVLNPLSGGVTVGRSALIALPFGWSLAETEHVLAHELVHAFQYEAAGRSQPAFPDLPSWFVEGMAECLALGPDDPAVLCWIREAARRKGPPGLSDLGDAPHLAYRAGHAAWRFLVDRFGAGVVPRLLHAPGNFARKVEAVLGLTVAELSAQWRRAVAEGVRRDSDERAPAAEYGRGEAFAPPGRTLAVDAVAPSLSPDGRLLVWASPGMPGELWLADSFSGSVRRQLLAPGINPRYDSLQVLNSSAGWEPRGRRLAVAASRDGRPLLVIVDTATGHCEREIRLEEPGEISGVAWSPDGRQLAFAGQAGGWTDLYLHHLETGTVRRLTDDAFADIQPAWTPDGGSLVFATDRFTTDLAALRSGPLRLGVIDVTSGVARELPGTHGGGNVSPRVLSSGEILFLGEADRRPSVYQLSPSRGEIVRLTQLDVEVSGPTRMSPAITTARGGVFAYSAFRGGRYEIVLTRLPSMPGATLHASFAGRPAGE